MSEERKYASGSWKWSEDCRWLFDEQGRLVLWYTTEDDGIHCSLANARLIAAAPDMYEALLKADDALSNRGVFDDDEPRLSIRAAIAKARGETA